jgi:hypothetical protein
MTETLGLAPAGSAWPITSAEIAALARVKRPMVSNWARRHPDFPAPISREGERLLFDGRAIVEWLLLGDDTGKSYGNAKPEQLRADLALYALSAWCGALPADDLIDAITSLICLRQQYDRPVAGGDWDALLDRAADLDAEDSFLLRELRAVPAEHGPALASLADELTEAAFNPGEALEWVLDARRRLGAHILAVDAPAPALARALARACGIAELESESVIAVPNSRAGDLLVALHAKAKAQHTYIAAEPHPRLTRLTRRRMLTRGVLEFQLDVAEGAELSVEDWGDPDVLLSVLPYEAGERRDPLVALERAQACTDLLADGCIAVVLGPADAFTGSLPAHGEADGLRRSFLTEGLLKAAIGLPEGALPYRPGYRTAIWVLARTPLAERRGRVLLADLTSQPLSEAVMDDFVADLGIWRTAAWTEDPRHEPRRGVVIAAQDLNDTPGMAFTPQHRSELRRHSRTVIERPVRIGELEIRLESLAEDARRALDGPPVRTQVAFRPGSDPMRRTSVRHLVKERRVRKRPGHRIAAEHLTGDGHYAVIGSEEVTGTSPIGSRRIAREIVFSEEFEHVELTEPGDIIVTANPRFGVHVDVEGLSVVVFPARVLRVRTDTDRPVRPRVLAALLRAAADEHQRAAGAVRASTHIDDLAVPDLDPDEAGRYEALLIDIARRSALLREQAAALEDLNRLTAAGVHDGTLTV